MSLIILRIADNTLFNAWRSTRPARTHCNAHGCKGRKQINSIAAKSDPYATLTLSCTAAHAMPQWWSSTRIPIRLQGTFYRTKSMQLAISRTAAGVAILDYVLFRSQQRIELPLTPISITTSLLNVWPEEMNGIQPCIPRHVGGEKMHRVVPEMG